jgi:hypothetical protein|tara:strand:+ start:1128 stop:5522 length:4395 start_codon:yes stop_codon:yes gene_type:complete
MANIFSRIGSRIKQEAKLLPSTLKFLPGEIKKTISKASPFVPGGQLAKGIGETIARPQIQRLQQQVEENERQLHTLLIQEIQGAKGDQEKIDRLAQIANQTRVKGPLESHIEEATTPRQIIASAGELALIAATGLKTKLPVSATGKLIPQATIKSLQAAKVAKTAQALKGAGKLKKLAVKVGKPALKEAGIGGLFFGTAKATEKDASIKDIIRAAELGVIIGGGAILATTGIATGAGKVAKVLKPKITRGLQRAGIGLEKIAAGKPATKSTTQLQKTLSFIGEKKTIQQKTAQVALAAVKKTKKLKTRLIDRFSPLQRVESRISTAIGRPLKESEKVYRNARLTQSVADAKAEQLVIRYNPKINQFGDDITKKSKAYLTQLDLIDRARLGQKVAGDQTLDELITGLKTLTQEIGADDMQKVGQIRQTTRLFHKNLLQQRVDAGLLNKTQMDRLLATHPNYIPHNVMMDIDEQAVRWVGNSLNVPKTDIMKAVGSTRNIDDPFVATIQRTPIATRTIEKNKVLKGLVEAQEELSLFEGMGKITGEVKPGKVVETGAITKPVFPPAKPKPALAEKVKPAPLARVTAKKGTDGKFQLFWIGTKNFAEVGGKLIDDKFVSAKEARNTFEALWIKDQQQTIQLALKPKIKLRQAVPPALVKKVAPIPKTLEPLAKEARKFKTAEEFVEAQPKLFHGTTKQSASSIEKSGFEVGGKTNINKDFIGIDKELLGDVIWFTDTPQRANVFAGQSGRLKFGEDAGIVQITESNLKLAKPSDSIGGTLQAENAKAFRVKIEDLKSKGFDGLQRSRAETIVWNTDKIKTKSQLTDFFNQATKAEPTPTPSIIEPLAKPIPKTLEPLAKEAGEVKPKEGFGTINLFRDGVKETWVVPEDIAIAIKNLDTPVTPNWWKLLTTPQRLLKKGATQFNLSFALPNKFRDKQTAALTAESFITELAKKTGVSPKSVNLTKKEIEKLYKVSGGFGGSIFREGESKIFDQLTKIGIKSKVQSTNPAKLVTSTNESLEQSTRMQTFKRGLEAGLSPKDAALASRDVTIDFAKMGTWMRPLNQAIPFLNARIQGFVNLPKAIAKNPEAFARMQMYTATYPTIALHAHNRRFESYKDISQYYKDKYWVIMTGETDAIDDFSGQPIKVPQFITIPKGEGQALVSGPIQHYLDKSDGADFRKTSEMIADVLGSASPLEFQAWGDGNIWTTGISMLGPGASIPVGLGTNIEPYSGRKIIPESRKQAPKELQFRKTTPETTKKLAKILDLAPAKVAFVLNSFGGLPQDMQRAADIVYGVVREGKLGGNSISDTPFGAVTQVPISRRFLREAQPSFGPEMEFRKEQKEELKTGIVGEKLKIKDRAEQIFIEMNKRETKDERVQYLNSLGDELTLDIKKKIKSFKDFRKSVEVLKKTDSVELRARYILQRLDEQKEQEIAKEDRVKFLDELDKAKILTKAVRKRIAELKASTD